MNHDRRFLVAAAVLAVAALYAIYFGHYVIALVLLAFAGGALAYAAENYR